MNFEAFSPGEIRRMYDGALSKDDMLKVLADLTCCSVYEMADFLGVKVKVRTRHKMDAEKALQLYRMGLNCRQIAEELNIPYSTVYSWHKRKFNV